MGKKYFSKVILSHPKDNVATARLPIQPGTSVALIGGKEIVVKEEVPFGHKIALRNIPRGGAIIKYGERIGRATREIKPGEWVHLHNVTGERGRLRAKRKGNRT